MGRRKKGLPIDGWLVVDKPVGVGSTDVVSKARWALNARKAGHSGTLDPLASGVLAVAFGEATKTIPYAVDSEKRYEFNVVWGATTATDDLEGVVVARSERRPSEAEIRHVLADFTGKIMQIPPAFSAIKVDGARAYDLARAGENVTLAAREIDVYTLELIEIISVDEARFAMTCGKGGYVRSMARDLGEALGCLGHVSVLRRLSTGPFNLSQAIDFEQFEAVREGAALTLLPNSFALEHLPRVDVSPEDVLRLRNGNPVQIHGVSLPYGETAWAARGEDTVAIGQVRAEMFHPKRILAAPEN